MRITALLIILFFSVAAAASADPGFNFIGDSINITTSSGTTLNPSFTVNNTGTTGLNIDFAALTLTKGSDVLDAGTISSISNLANGSSQQVTSSINVPKQQIPGIYTGTLTANSNASISDTLDFKINVTPAYDAIADISQISLGSARLNSTHIREFNVTNMGNADLTNVFFSFSASQVTLMANNTNFALPFNQTETIKINITIPGEFSTGNVTLGNVKLSSTQLNKDLFSISANVGGGIIIEDLDVFLTTRKSENEEHLDILDGEKLDFGEEEAGPGSELRFNFNIENTFSDEEDIDLNDAKVTVIIAEIDDGADIEEESSSFEVNADSTQEVDIIVKVPLLVAAGSYDILIEVEGEDDNGNTHTAQMQLELEIDKESRDIAITQASVSPATIGCSGTATASATLTNLGNRVEEAISLHIINEELGINVADEFIELSEDPFDEESEFSASHRIEIKEDAKDGTYPIEFRAYIAEGAVWETKKVDLNVECDASDETPKTLEEKEQEAKDNIPIILDEAEDEENDIGPDISVLEPETSKEVTLMQRPGFWAGLILLNLALVSGIVYFASNMINKNKKK